LRDGRDHIDRAVPERGRGGDGRGGCEEQDDDDGRGTEDSCRPQSSGRHRTSLSSTPSDGSLAHSSRGLAQIAPMRGERRQKSSEKKRVNDCDSAAFHSDTP
jgi:hypothetical protein